MMDDERRLLRAMARRDRSAWAAMYERHVGDVFGLFITFSVVTETPRKTCARKSGFSPLSGSTGSTSVAGCFEIGCWGSRHRVLHHHRRTALLAAAPITDEPSLCASPLDLLVQGERAHVVRAALLCLDGDQRRVLQDKYAEGLSVAEIAHRTGRSAKAVESLLSRARARLREFAPVLLVESDERRENMNRSTCDGRDPDAESLLQHVIAEAGDPAVVPRPEFVAELRSLLLERLGPPRRAPFVAAKVH